MTHRSEEEGSCQWCHGRLSIIVSRDPDEEVDCVCTDPIEKTAPTFSLDAESLLSKWGFGDGDALSDWWWDEFGEDPPFNDHDVLHALVVVYLVPAIRDAAREVEIFRIDTIHNPVRAKTLDGVQIDHYSARDRRIDPPIVVDVSLGQIEELAAKLVRGAPEAEATDV